MPGHVPPSYFCQVQLCLEICNLDVAHFVEYRPPSLTWPLDAELHITVVHRDRNWFKGALPVLKDVHEEIQRARDLAVGGGEIPYPPRTRQKSSRTHIKRPVKCIIEDNLYGPIPKLQKTVRDECLFTANDCQLLNCLF